MWSFIRRLSPVALAYSIFAAAPAAALNPLLPPSGNFDLTHWYLTLPSAAEVDTTTLSHGYTLPGTFYTDNRGGMVFRCPNIAGTTTNTHYSRTELRELLSPLNSSYSDDANNWTPEKGGRMKARLRVDHVSTTGDSSKVGRVIVGQIHGPSTEPARLYFHKLPGEAKARMYLASETTGGSEQWSTDIVSNKNGGGIALGELFTYVITLKGTRLQVDVITGTGTAQVTNTYIRTIDSNYLGKNLYFKAGNYNQNNTGSATDYAQVTFYSLVHTH